MQVIRCERPDRPLRGGAGAELGFGWKHLPTPFEDPGINRRMEDDEHCATTAEQLSLWFPPDIREYMRHLGYRFVVLDVPEHAVRAVGTHQVLIARAQCGVVGEYLQ